MFNVLLESVSPIIELVNAFENVTPYGILSVAFYIALSITYKMFGEKEFRDAIIQMIRRKEKVGTLEMREDISEKIQEKLIELCYSLNADRACVIEAHNGKENVTNMPFKYWDMTYEEVNTMHHAVNISDSYKDVMTSHYKLPYYLSKNEIFVGDMEELEKVDARFTNNMRDSNGDYLGIIVLRSDGKNIGFLCISYDKIENKPQDRPERKDIVAKLEVYEKMIAPLLDVSKQLGKY